MKVRIEPVKMTKSVCPVCLRQTDARIVRRGSDRYMKKTCPEHGDFSCVIWRGEPEMESWGAYRAPSPVPEDCPHACGLCPGHLQDTCCVLVEVTHRCDLGCPFCFADAGSAEPEMTPAELGGVFRTLAADGRSFIQLSGGEPCVRDDLPEVIAEAKKAGATSIQLNSNGLRLASDPDFARRCAEAGLDFVFMQFDGVTDDVYEKLRGRPLLEIKKRAIEVCDGLGVGVTLVPTVVPGVNDSQIGEIIRFGLSKSPAVRGVHFQPVSWFGRVPREPDDADRITLPEVLRAITEQTDGLIKLSDLAPSSCDHPRCGFHGDFVAMPDGVLALSKTDGCCCGHGNAALKNRRFVARRWKRTDGGAEPGTDMTDMATFLSRVKRNGFTITGMAFQDRMNLDLERVRTCSLHVWDGGKIVPFCVKYM
ncbi:MAG: radical SAM protein [Oscillospiraceae bacterium]|nr:radical SAM protein [Oscillospiraceae bacterium]